MAIGLSIACAIHCLSLPVLLLMLPSIATLELDNEAFDFRVVVAVIPCSFYALFLGCKEHNHRQPFFGINWVNDVGADVDVRGRLNRKGG